jgi:hypothetical protein
VGSWPGVEPLAEAGISDEIGKAERHFPAVGLSERLTVALDAQGQRHSPVDPGRAELVRGHRHRRDCRRVPFLRVASFIGAFQIPAF